MPTIRIPKTADLPYIIDNSNTHYLVKKGVKLQGDADDDFLIQESEGSESNTIRIDGSVLLGTYDTAIDLMGSGTTLLIGKHGTVSGETGVRLSGADQTFINNGTVYGHVVLNNAENLKDFQNNGEIRGSIDFGRSTLDLVLGKESEIHGSFGYGINRWTETGVATSTINKGLIKAWDSFISSGGDDTFINKGTLKGDVNLGAGNDTFINTKRGMVANIYGGDGDDTYTLLNTSYTTVFEEVGGGNDILMGNEIFLERGSEIETLILVGDWKSGDALGNEFDNHITGNSGKNRLSGGGGSDTLEGGAAPTVS